MNFIIGLLGALTFESLRVYKIVTHNKKKEFFFKDGYLWLYISVVVIILLMGGVIAYIINPTELYFSFLIGMSLPTGTSGLAKIFSYINKISVEEIKTVKLDNAGFLNKLKFDISYNSKRFANYYIRFFSIIFDK